MRIFINAGHFIKDKGEESLAVMDIRDKLIGRVDAIFVPDVLDLRESINWINERCSRGDLAIGIHLNKNNDHRRRGVEGYHDGDPYIAEVFARNVAEELQIPNRGAIHDSLSGPRSLGFLRLMKCDSVIIECGYLTNDEDYKIITSEEGKEKIACGIVNAINEMLTIEDLQTTIKSLRQVVDALIKLISQLLSRKK